ncbi:hypothetical protein LOTGIDRAFT_157949 [Lottia gigantea]|uniref:DED domain-containing protein n=1 Tax=Lottia gigantea TaxID=225164 RepID=V4B2K9_LOTGI|nr:hypothetical protein LOTGIDRAFT_157949 [Lottia gigantea]ESP00662.1 hypothetical protein LOTGIDRAFT_157949 [Lottia gigantea]
MEDRNSDFRAMLISIAISLDQKELKTLIFYAKIKRNLAETIHQVTDLFQILEERQDLKPNDLSYFRKMISVLETRRDLLKIIDEYVRDNEMVDGDDGKCSNHLEGPQQNHDSGDKYPIMARLNAEVLADRKLKQKEDILDCNRDVIERKGRGELHERCEQMQEIYEQLQEGYYQLGEIRQQIQGGIERFDSMMNRISKF